MVAITKVYNHFFLNLKGSCPFSDDVSNGVKQRETMLDIKESNWQPKPSDYMMSLAFWLSRLGHWWVEVLGSCISVIAADMQLFDNQDEIAYLMYLSTFGAPS